MLSKTRYNMLSTIVFQPGRFVCMKELSPLLISEKVMHVMKICGQICLSGIFSLVFTQALDDILKLCDIYTG